MATSVTIDSVTTTDAVPAAAPHRISAKATKDTAFVTLTPYASPAPVPREAGAYPDVALYPNVALYPDLPAGLVPQGSTLYPGAGLLPPFNPGTGGLLPGAGAQAVLGVRVVDGGGSPYTGVLLGRKGLPCSESVPCSEGAVCSDWSLAPNVQLEVDAVYPQSGAPADGPQTVYVYADFDGVWA